MISTEERQRCVSVLTAVHALHNWRHYATTAGVVDQPWGIEVAFRDTLSTFDTDGLTRLVKAAHVHRVRVELHGHGFGCMKLRLHPRSATGDLCSRHPGLEVFEGEP